MTQEHPITPPPELVKQWKDQWLDRAAPDVDTLTWIATQAARWGADQELEACCKLLELSDSNTREFLYSARRPKPPSLKEQALQAAQRFYANGHEDCNDEEIKDDFDIICRALESLPD